LIFKFFIDFFHIEHPRVDLIDYAVPKYFLLVPD